MKQGQVENVAATFWMRRFLAATRVPVGPNR